MTTFGRKIKTASAAAWPTVAQIVGYGATIGGIYTIAGLGVTLIIGGLSLFAAGFLREAKVI